MSSKKYVVTTEAAEAELDKSYRTFAAERPWLVPMVCKPRDWTHNYGGGYLRFRLPFVKDKSWRMKGDSVPSKEAMDAVNTMQATPWAINSDVYEIALLARDRGLEEILPVAPVRPMPERLPDAEFAALDREGRSALSLKRRSIHDHNNRLESRRKTMRRQLEVAREFEMQPAIYFPHCVDFRGRAYPLPQDLHPQSDDFGRGLLVFAERKQLGEHGLEWLCYHLANTYGIDKEDRPAQLEWVHQHEDWISTVAVDPLGAGFEFLAAAEEPWQFLASAIEFDKAIQLQAPGEYWSNLPVAVDGSCNGLQHLSAMGLDPVGARAVNLTNAPRQDIYGIVADKVADGVLQDSVVYVDSQGQVGHPSGAWYGRVTRKTVKRGVMTVPYGLTDAGMADQLIADRHTDGLAGDPKVNAQYLRDRMKEALEDTVEKATEIMEWMQYNAKVLTEANVPVEWHTPSGFMVHQGYYKSRPATFTIFGIGKEKRVGVQLQDRDDDAGLMPTKQKLAVAPNIIHSFDAAHMVQAVNALPRGTAVAVVHDSYATHACDVPEMVGTLKRTFVEIYEQDWFESLQRDFQACAERAFEPVRLLPPPERGEFDINEVHNAEYFFA
jgi:DNA-directed RNA polymerase